MADRRALHPFQARPAPAGRPAGPIDVRITARPTRVSVDQRGAIPAPDRREFRSSAISDGRGHFRLIQRIPPGTFTAHASRPGASSVSRSTSSTPLGTRQDFTVMPGQRRVFLTLDLPAR